MQKLGVILHFSQIILIFPQKLDCLLNLHGCVGKQYLLSPLDDLVHSVQTQHPQSIYLINHGLHQLFLHVKPFDQQTPILVKFLV